MGKGKTALQVTAAIILVALLAGLPKLTALWQDRTILGTPALGEIQTVELNIQEELPGLALLALAKYGENWEFLDATGAAMSEEEAVTAALAALAPYQEAGLIEGGLVFYPYIVEHRAVSIPVGAAGIFWQVVLVSEDNYGEVDLILDDATGKILHINYGSEGTRPEKEYDDVLDTFARLYFGQLGIESYPQAAVTELENAYVGDNAAAQRYRFGDKVYGEIDVDLHVFQHGFYTDFYG